MEEHIRSIGTDLRAELFHTIAGEMNFLEVRLGSIPFEQDDRYIVFGAFQGQKAQRFGLGSMYITSVSQYSLKKLISLARMRFEPRNPYEMIFKGSRGNLISP